MLFSTHSHDPRLWAESDHPASGTPASLSIHRASSSTIPAGSVHKSRGDNVDSVEEMMCVVCVTEGA